MLEVGRATFAGAEVVVDVLLLVVVGLWGERSRSRLRVRTRSDIVSEQLH